MSFLKRFRKEPESNNPTVDSDLSRGGVEQNQLARRNQNSLESAPDFDSNLAAERTTEAIEKQQNQKRQERKTIAAFLYSPDFIGKHDVNLPNSTYDEFYEKLNNGEITDSNKSNFLQYIAAPFTKSMERTIDNIRGEPDPKTGRPKNKHELRILATLASNNFDFWESTSIYDLENFVDRYPTPYELKNDEESFLKIIKDHNDAEKYSEYQDAMERFKKKVYGKRYEYYKTLESLEEKAKKKSATDTLRTELLDSYNTPTEKQAPPEKPIEVFRLSHAEQSHILENSKISGDSFPYNGREYQLTPTSLEQLNLAPIYTFNLDNAKINLSNPYQVGNHPAVTAYVETDNGTNVCSYYRSNSQGVWRLLPDYVANTTSPNKNVVSWFGKGYSEESLNLPSSTQAVLEAMMSNVQPLNLDPVNAEFAFAGTAKRHSSKDEYARCMSTHTLHGLHYSEVASSPALNLGEISYNKVNPETLDITGPSAPNFDQPGASYITDTDLYGQIKIEHFPSSDGSLQYTFNRTPQSQAWLGGIEIKESPLSSFGLRTSWASAGDYGTPLYEYEAQDGGYGDHNNRSSMNHRYVNMWKNYLSRMPLIQKYIAARR